MAAPVPSVHRTILVVDVANFGSRDRTIPEQLAVRDAMYRLLRTGFDAAGVSWAKCDHEDRGDGLFVLVPPDVPKACFTQQLPSALLRELTSHNSGQSPREQIRLRVALHAGEVGYDDHGVTSPAVNLAFRLIDASALKAALDNASEPLAIVVSAWFFDEVVRHSPASDPSSYREISVQVKETDTTAWLTIPSSTYQADNLPASPTRAPAILPPLHTLLGRDTELSQLTELLRDAVAGRGKAVLIDGEPGIGKSALARTVCANAGCLVLWGTGDELGQALPLLPLLDALRMIPGGKAHPRIAAIGRLLRGEVPLGGADPVAAASEQIIALVTELCAAEPLVLVVDDLQWADRQTIAVWTRLSKTAGQLRLLLIGITRPIPRSVQLSALRRAAADHVQLTIGPLLQTAVVDLVTVVIGGKPSNDLLRLTDGTAGNPLFLTELIDALQRAKALRVTEAGIAELVSGGVPASLPAAIENRLGFAVGWAGEVLRAAALLGTEFSPVELAEVLNQGMPELSRTLDEARAAGVLRETGGNLAFRHPLIRQVLYESMPAGVRTAWHLEAARALAQSGTPVHRVARQLLHAVRDHVEPQDEWLTRWLVSAAPALVAQSPVLAAELLRVALANSSGGDHTTGLLACRLADALFRAGNIEEAERVAARTVATVLDPDLMVDLQWTLTQCRAMSGRHTESLAALQRSLTRPGIDPRHRARLLVLTARAHRDLGKVGDSVRIAHEALAEAEAIGDRWAIGWALHVLSIGSVMSGEVAQAIPLFDRALSVTEDDPALLDLRMLVQVNQAVALGDLDQYDAAIRTAHQVCRLAERLASMVRLAQARSALGELLFDVGHWDEALYEVAAVNDDIKDPAVACCDHGIAAVVYFHRNLPRQARRNLALTISGAERIGDRVIGSMGLARSLERECSGRPDEALAALTACLTVHAEELEEMEDLLPDAVRLAVSIGERSTAEHLAEQARALMERADIPHRTAADLYCRGLLDRDPDLLLLSAEWFVESGRLLPRAKALESAAIAIADRRGIGEARATFTAATELYTALGANWDINRVLATMGRYGIR